ADLQAAVFVLAVDAAEAELAMLDPVALPRRRLVEERRHGSALSLLGDRRREVSHDLALDTPGRRRRDDALLGLLGGGRRLSPRDPARRARRRGDRRAGWNRGRRDHGGARRGLFLFALLTRDRARRGRRTSRTLPCFREHAAHA